MTSCTEYKRLSAKAVVELAAPHTWPASVLPVMLGAALSLRFARAFHPGLLVSVLLTAVFLQMSVNTINDYSDFVKGTDTRENSDDETDASIVYNRINPRSALILGLGFIALAAVCGLYAILSAGPVTLLFGGVGAAVVLAYSLGRLPISYLPLGECVSGFVMGGLITMGSYFVFTGIIRFDILLYALPLVVSIGLIMLANNTSDIERDLLSGRRTFPVLAGRTAAAAVLRTGMLLDIAAVLLLAALRFRGGLPIAFLMVVALLPPVGGLLRSAMGPDCRTATMRDILAMVRRHGIGYSLIILADFLSTLTA